jgi:hypothetical protein
MQPALILAPANLIVPLPSLSQQILAILQRHNCIHLWIHAGNVVEICGHHFDARDLPGSNCI